MTGVSFGIPANARPVSLGGGIATTAGDCSCSTKRRLMMVAIVVLVLLLLVR